MGYQFGDITGWVLDKTGLGDKLVEAYDNGNPVVETIYNWGTDIGDGLDTTAEVICTQNWKEHPVSSVLITAGSTVMEAGDLLSFGGVTRFEKGAANELLENHPQMADVVTASAETVKQNGILSVPGVVGTATATGCILASEGGKAVDQIFGDPNKKVGFLGYWAARFSHTTVGSYMVAAGRKLGDMLAELPAGGKFHESYAEKGMSFADIAAEVRSDAQNTIDLYNQQQAEASGATAPTPDGTSAQTPTVNEPKVEGQGKPGGTAQNRQEMANAIDPAANQPANNGAELTK